MRAPWRASRGRGARPQKAESGDEVRPDRQGNENAAKELGDQGHQQPGIGFARMELVQQLEQIEGHHGLRSIEAASFL